MLQCKIIQKQCYNVDLFCYTTADSLIISSIKFEVYRCHSSYFSLFGLEIYLSMLTFCQHFGRCYSTLFVLLLMFV